MHKNNPNYNQYLTFALEMRDSYIELSKTAGSADPLFSVDDFEIQMDDDQSALAARLYTPTETPVSDSYPLVLFVHGGGWVSGNLETHDVLARAISLNLNAIVLAVDYRLAPEVDAFQQIEDVKASFLWLYNHAEKLKGNQQKIIGIGDSAGAALITNLSSQLKKGDVFAQWLMYPVIGLDITTPSAQKYGDQYFPTNEVMPLFWNSQLPEGVVDNDSRISPFFAEIEKLPPTLTTVAGLDPLTSNAQTYMQLLSSKGIQSEIKLYEGAEHGFLQFFKDKVNHPLGQKAFDDGIDVLKSWIAL